MKIEDIPELPGYISVSRVAAKFGMTKASIYYKIYEQGAFRHVYKVTGSDDDQRPVLLLLESEVEQVYRAEKERENYVPLRERTHAWNKRVKQWGRDSKWGGGVPIHAAGQAHRDLQLAYVKAHPDDPRPE